MMNYQAVIEEAPEYIVYCKSGGIAECESMGEFIQSAAKKCPAANPDMECVTLPTTS